MCGESLEELQQGLIELWVLVSTVYSLISSVNSLRNAPPETVAAIARRGGEVTTVCNRCAGHLLAATTAHQKATGRVNATKVGRESIAMVSAKIPDTRDEQKLMRLPGQFARPMMCVIR